MNRRKLYGVSGLVILFFLSFNFFSGDSEGKKEYELEGVKSVDSLKEVDQFFYDQTPGLKRAEKRGLVTELDKTIKLDYLNGFLHLDKIWNTAQGSMLFYSRDIGSIGKDKDGPATPSIHRMTFHKQEDRREFGGIYTSSGGMPPSSGVQFNGRYYHRININAYNPQAKTMIQKKAFPVGFSLNVDGQRDYVKASQFPFGYDKTKEEYQNYTINKSIDLKPMDATLHIHKLKFGFFTTKLHYEVETNKPKDLQHVDLRLLSNKESIRGNYSKERVTNNNSVEFHETLRPISKIPDQITFSLQKVVTNSNKSVSFTMNTSAITEESSAVEKTIHKKLGNEKNTDIYYESYHYDPDGEFHVSLKYKTPKTLKKPFIHLQKTNPRPILHKDQKRYRFHVEAYNEKGDIALDGSSSAGPGRYEKEIGFGIRKDIAKESNRIDISVNDLPYELLLDEKITVALEK